MNWKSALIWLGFTLLGILGGALLGGFIGGIIGLGIDSAQGNHPLPAAGIGFGLIGLFLGMVFFG